MFHGFVGTKKVAFSNGLFHEVVEEKSDMHQNKENKTLPTDTKNTKKNDKQIDSTLCVLCGFVGTKKVALFYCCDIFSRRLNDLINLLKSKGLPWPG